MDRRSQAVDANTSLCKWLAYSLLRRDICLARRSENQDLIFLACAQQPCRQPRAKYIRQSQVSQASDRIALSCCRLDIKYSAFLLTVFSVSRAGTFFECKAVFNRSTTSINAVQLAPSQLHYPILLGCFMLLCLHWSCPAAAPLVYVYACQSLLAQGRMKADLNQTARNPRQELHCLKLCQDITASVLSSCSLIVTNHLSSLYRPVLATMQCNDQ